MHRLDFTYARAGITIGRINGALGKSFLWSHIRFGIPARPYCRNARRGGRPTPRKGGGGWRLEFPAAAPATERKKKILLNSLATVPQSIGPEEWIPQLLVVLCQYIPQGGQRRDEVRTTQWSVVPLFGKRGDSFLLGQTPTAKTQVPVRHGGIRPRWPIGPRPRWPRCDTSAHRWR